MKRIYKLVAGLVTFASLVSCNLNEVPGFDPEDSFVAFSKASVMVNEDAGTITLPVYIASIDPVKTMVTYEVVAETAKEGVNFDLVDESAVMVFDGKNREGAVQIDITDLKGEYTGDLKFSVKLVSGGADLNIGAENVCEVTIADLDHPLAAILGEYTASATDFFAGAPASWSLTILKDAEQVNIVWIKGLTPSLGGFPNSEFYGTVSEDLKEITIPCGQKSAFVYPGAGPISIGALDAAAGQYSTDGNIVMTMTEDGVFTSPDGIYVFITEMDGPNGVDGIVNDGNMKWTKK